MAIHYFRKCSFVKKCSDKVTSVLEEKGVNTAESGKFIVEDQYKAPARREQQFKNLDSYMISCSSADLFKSQC